MAVFSDINLGILDEKSDILYDEDALRQQFLLRFTTQTRTRVKLRGFASALENKLFEPLDDITAEEIRQMLLNIAAEDTRVVISQSEVLPDKDNQRFYCSFTMYCPALRKEFDLNFNLLSK